METSAAYFGPHLRRHCSGASKAVLDTRFIEALTDSNGELVWAYRYEP
ncbi:MAG: hypothetical protein JWM47_1646 [Acidimicrobiales bacterium]|nr:hypothetical protein [Acidimicrobiales bacterium]